MSTSRIIKAGIMSIGSNDGIQFDLAIVNMFRPAVNGRSITTTTTASAGPQFGCWLHLCLLVLLAPTGIIIPIFLLPHETSSTTPRPIALHFSHLNGHSVRHRQPDGSLISERANQQKQAQTHTRSTMVFSLSIDSGPPLVSPFD